jgi:hypothetical protein
MAGLTAQLIVEKTLRGERATYTRNRRTPREVSQGQKRPEKSAFFPFSRSPFLTAFEFLAFFRVMISCDSER